MNVAQVLTREEFGLDRRATRRGSQRALVHVAEAEIVRWGQFRAGVLLFAQILADPEPAFNVSDRKWGRARP